MSWMESLGKNLIKKVEVNIGDNKTIAEIVDGNLNLKVQHYYKNQTIIENPVRVGVDPINTITSPNRDLRIRPQIPKNNVSPWSGKSAF